MRLRGAYRFRGGGVARARRAAAKASVSDCDEGVVIGGGGFATWRSCSAQPSVSCKVQGSAAAIRVSSSRRASVASTAAFHAFTGRTSVGLGGTERKVG